MAPLTEANTRHEKLTLRRLNGWYRAYNRGRYAETDPVEYLHRYDDDRDREVVGIVASSLAYGRVSQIQKSVEKVLSRLGSPTQAVTEMSKQDLGDLLLGFKHRFTTDDELISFLFGVGQVIRRHGSLGNCFASNTNRRQETPLPALQAFTDELTDAAANNCRSLIPRPSRGSACKRLNLYLRWMVRKDNIDLGLWRDVPARNLIVPLDTHMHRFALTHGLTKRKSADMKTALEITRGFSAFSPEDPVKYDFAITRRGMLGKVDGA